MLDIETKGFSRMNTSAVTYKQSHSDRVITWNPAIDGFYFILVDRYPQHPTVSNQSLHLHLGSVSRHYLSTDEAIADFAKMRSKFPDYIWDGTNARVVKAACAFDAREHGVLIQSLV